MHWSNESIGGDGGPYICYLLTDLGRGTPAPGNMWKTNKSKVLIEETPDEEAQTQPEPQSKDQLLQADLQSPVSQLATKVQGASFRGWKDVTSIFNKDDEQQLLKGSKSPKTKVASVKTKEDVKTEKKSGFWDSLAIKQNIQPKKADEIEGWEPPHIMVEDPPSFAEEPLDDNQSWQGWEEETKGSSKYTNLASSGNSSRWSIKSAGKLVSIRRRSKGNLTENWEELE
ncbi:testis development-related protein isoform X1 [Rhinoderma darwinii]|uniref:testis development-related protein isoform X1 n=2 Tax=Rhinoderma darwinii TaxID=43563 RepID=UPI003F67CFCE